MQTALEFYELIDERDQRLVQDVGYFLAGLEDKGHPNGNADHLWSCHALCIAAQVLFRPDGWRVAHGRFGDTNDHTWLVRQTLRASDISRFERGYRERVGTKTILDVYPVASYGGPILLDASGWSSPWQKLYIEDRRRYKATQVRAWHDDASIILSMVKI